MNLDIRYPAILIGKKGVWMVSDSEQLTITQKSLLGLYNNRLMVDSVGRARHVKEARELGNSGGALSRLREFWNPSRPIRVDLAFDSEVTVISVDELKERLLESFAGRDPNIAAWNPGTIDFEQLQVGLKASATFEEVFRLVREFITIRRELL